MIASDEEYGITWADVEHGERFQHLWKTYATLVSQTIVDDAVSVADNAVEARAMIDREVAQRERAADAKRAADKLRDEAIKRAATINSGVLFEEISKAKASNPYLMADLHEVQTVQQAIQQGTTFQTHQIDVPVPAYTMIRMSGNGSVMPARPGEMVMGLTVAPCSPIPKTGLGITRYTVQVVMK